MEAVNATTLKKHFSDYLNKVEQGQTILIQRQGHAPVKLVPVKTTDWRDNMTMQPRLLVSEEDAFSSI